MCRLLCIFQVAFQLYFRLPETSKPLSALLRFQHLPPLQFLQQQRFDFLRARLQAAGFFVVFEDFGVGKLGI